MPNLARYVSRYSFALIPVAVAVSAAVGACSSAVEPPPAVATVQTTTARSPAQVATNSHPTRAASDPRGCTLSQPAPATAMGAPSTRAAPTVHSASAASGLTEEICNEHTVRKLLTEPEFPGRPISFGDDLPLFRAIEGFGLDDKPSTLHTLFAVLLASHDDRHLQRAALFSLVRRAPASLELAARLLDADLPEVSRLVRILPRVSRAVRRSYARAMAAAVLGNSGLEAAHAPLTMAFGRASTNADRVLFAVALARLGREDATEVLRETLAHAPIDAEVERPHASGLVHLLPTLEDLLLPCSFEIMRLGSPPLAVEVLADAAELQADERLAPLLLELAQRTAPLNEQVSDSLASSAAELAPPAVFTTIADWVRQLPRGDRNIHEWIDQFAPAYARCGEDLGCHLCAVQQPDAEMWHYRSSAFVAARLPADQGPALLGLMERMARPFWFAAALDRRLTHPTPEQIARVRVLPPPTPDDARLYAPRSSSCARLDSPFDELAIRLEVRARQAGQR